MIIKEFATPNGVSTGFHVLKRIEVIAPFTSAHMNVQSYASEAAFLAGSGPVWSSPVDMPLGLLDGGLADIAEIWLTTDTASPFAGGVIVVDQSLTLETAKMRAWSRIKQARSVAELADFTCEGSVYQADKERITGAMQLALLAQAAGTSYSISWTLSDNTTKTLDAAGMIAVGAALVLHVAGAFAIGRDLRERLAAATTIDQVNAVQWPVAGGGV